MGLGDPPSLSTRVVAESQRLCVSTTWGLGGHERLAFTSVLATCLLGCIVRCVHPLSFQTQRQYIEATNESNRIFLYCAFLDFRYCLRGRVPGRGGGRGGDGGSWRRVREVARMSVLSHTPNQIMIYFFFFFFCLSSPFLTPFGFFCLFLMPFFLCY